MIEVLVAAVLLATAVVGVLGAFSASSRALGVAQFNSTAVRLAQAKMADIRIQLDLPLGESSGDFGDQYSGYTWSLSIQPATDAVVAATGGQQTLQGLYQIDLTVGGRVAGRPREVVFTTYTM